MGRSVQKVVNLENSLDIKEATAELLKTIMPYPDIDTYIMIDRRGSLLKPGQCSQRRPKLGFFAAFNTFIGGIAGMAGLF